MDSLSINIPKENSIAISILNFIDRLDTFRIKTHLRIVEVQLRSKNVDNLSPELKAAREANLDRLHAYWVAGIFPKNLDFKGQFVPYFKDAVDTPCAMAYLIEESGSRALVSEVARVNNFVYINDIKEGPVLDWINTSGLTQSESARIQPTYGGIGDYRIPSPTPVPTENFIIVLLQNSPLVVGLLSFLVLEFFSFKLAAWIGGERSGRRAVALFYFTLNTVVLAVGLGFLTQLLLNSIIYSRYF
jgi:hypothetical protein